MDIVKLARNLHRDLGFFAVGIMIIYALSGIVMIFRDTNFLKHEVTISKELEANLKGKDLPSSAKIKNLSVISEDENSIIFNSGTYDKSSGIIEYQSNELIFPFNRFAQYHKMRISNDISWVAIIFGLILLFQAVSSFFMYPPKSKSFFRGMIITGVGIVTVIIVLILV